MTTEMLRACLKLSHCNSLIMILFCFVYFRPLNINCALFWIQFKISSDHWIIAVVRFRLRLIFHLGISKHSRIQTKCAVKYPIVSNALTLTFFLQSFKICLIFFLLMLLSLSNYCLVREAAIWIIRSFGRKKSAMKWKAFVHSLSFP